MVFIAPECGYASICVIFVFMLSLSVCMWILFLIFAVLDCCGCYIPVLEIQEDTLEGGRSGCDFGVEECLGISGCLAPNVAKSV